MLAADSNVYGVVVSGGGVLRLSRDGKLKYGGEGGI
jgi:hypothetical protein